MRCSWHEFMWYWDYTYLRLYVFPYNSILTFKFNSKEYYPLLLLLLTSQVLSCYCICSTVFPYNSPLIFSRPGWSQGLLSKHLCHSIIHSYINWLSHPLLPTALQCRYAQTVRYSSSSYKIDYVIVIMNFLNLKGHQNHITGSKVTAI